MTAEVIILLMLGIHLVELAIMYALKKRIDDVDKFTIEIARAFRKQAILELDLFSDIAKELCVPIKRGRLKRRDEKDSTVPNLRRKRNKTKLS